MEFINADQIMKQMYYGICITAVLIRYFKCLKQKLCIYRKKIEKRKARIEKPAANIDVVKLLNVVSKNVQILKKYKQ